MSFIWINNQTLYFHAPLRNLCKEWKKKELSFQSLHPVVLKAAQRYWSFKLKRAPTYSTLYVCSCITLCKVFKVVYRQVFASKLMQHVLYYPTTSNWSVCKSVYIILATTNTLNMKYTPLIPSYSTRHFYLFTHVVVVRLLED